MDKAQHLLIILITLFIYLSYPTQLCIADEKLSVEFQTGFFVPDNHAIRGKKIIFYNSDGDVSSIYSPGFGDSFEIKLALNYHLSSWVFRLDGGRKLAINEPSDEEKSNVNAYDENRLSIYSVLLNIIKEVSSKESKFTPFAGVGIGVYYLKWYESRIIKDPEFDQIFLTADTKTILGYNFLIGFKYRLLDKIFLKSEFSYDYAKGDIGIAHYYDNLDTERVNVGGNSFRVGIAYKIL